MLCLAYGSNMATQRVTARIPAQYRATARIDGYRLAFEQASHDGSSKCTIVPATSNDRVYGVVWEVAEKDKPTLDGYEGLGEAYSETWLDAKDVNTGTPLKVQVYIGNHPIHDVAPYDWYKHHVISGAREFSFPPDYIAVIDGIVAKADPDSQRSEQEWALYQGAST